MNEEQIKWLAELIKLMEQKPDSIIIGSAMTLFDKTGKISQPIYIVKSKE